jgi:hypothetical protein
MVACFRCRRPGQRCPGASIAASIFAPRPSPDHLVPPVTVHVAAGMGQPRAAFGTDGIVAQRPPEAGHRVSPVARRRCRQPNAASPSGVAKWLNSSCEASGEGPSATSPVSASPPPRPRLDYSCDEQVPSAASFIRGHPGNRCNTPPPARMLRNCDASRDLRTPSATA